MLEFKIDVVQALKDKGYTTYKIQKEKTFARNTYESIRNGIVPSAKALDTLCRLLNKQPGSIIRWVPDPEEEGAE